MLHCCSYEEYVPVRKRRELEEQRRLSLLGKARPSPAVRRPGTSHILR